MTRQPHQQPERERGQATTEIAVLFPALLLFLFAILQVALWSTARSVAVAAAEEGVRAGRAEGAPPGTSQAAARVFLEQKAGRFLTHTHINATGSTDRAVRVTVTGRSLSVIPGTYRVTARAHGPVEEWTEPRP